jgi:hypothetical protein
VIARAAGLPAGEHQGEVLVFTNGGQARVQVLLQVAPGTGMGRPATGSGDSGAAAGAEEGGNPSGAGQGANGAAHTVPVAALDAEERQALLKRVVELEPESTFERDFLRRVVHLIRAGEPLAPGELAKIYELEARRATQES